jgi:cytoskeletal protein RodZ
MKDYQKMSDQELDHIFVDAFQSVESDVPAFDTAYWNELEILLPQKPKRRIAAIWWFSAALMALLGGVLFWLQTTHVPGTQTSRTNKLSKQTSNSENTTSELTKRQLKETTQNTKNTNETVQQIDVLQQTKTPLNNHSEKENSNPKSPTSKRVSTPTSFTNGGVADVHELDETPSGLTVFEGADRIQTHAASLATNPSLIPTEYWKQKGDDDKESTKNWYAQLSFGMGNSYQTAVSDASTLVYGVGLGAGLHKRVGTMELQFGLQFRSEFIDNVKWKRTLQYTDGSGNTFSQIELNQINQLYSIDFPMGIGGYLGDKNCLMAQITPGIQLFGSGKQSLYQDDVMTNQRKQTSAVAHTTTMTMEIGLAYYRSLPQNYQVGASINTDIIRPFNSTYYLGNQTSFPVNVQLSLRKFF